MWFACSDMCHRFFPNQIRKLSKCCTTKKWKTTLIWWQGNFFFPFRIGEIIFIKACSEQISGLINRLFVRFFFATLFFRSPGFQILSVVPFVTGNFLEFSAIYERETKLSHKTYWNDEKGNLIVVDFFLDFAWTNLEVSKEMEKKKLLLYVRRIEFSACIPWYGQ